MAPGDLALNLEAGRDERKPTAMKREDAKNCSGKYFVFVALGLVVKNVFVHKEEAEGTTINPGAGGYMRWRVGSVLWCDGVDRPGAHGVNSPSG